MTCLIAKSAVDTIRRHAVEDYPREVCGLLVGRDESGERWVERAVPARNEAHEGDRYVVSPEDFLKAEREARPLGLEVVGFYHSHPDAEPSPSATDESQSWPHYTYLIVGVSERHAGAIEGWRRTGERFEREPVQFADAGEVRP
jgi:proteasome lid subunit RPN8/RPN11